jgi:hypothetical protein
VADRDDHFLLAEPLEFGPVGRDLRHDILGISDVRLEPALGITPGGEGRFDILPSRHARTLSRPRIGGGGLGVRVTAPARRGVEFALRGRSA